MKTIYDIRLENTRAAAERIGGQARLADRLGMSRQQVSHIIGAKTYKNIGGRLARRIEVGLQLPVGDLDQDRDMQPKELSPPTDTITIGPVPGTHDQKPGVAMIAVRKEWLRNRARFSAFDHLALHMMHGDAMTPSFDHDDLLLVDRGVSRVEADDVYLLAIDANLFVRRLQRQPGGDLVMLCDNCRYQPTPLDASHRSRMLVIGRVCLAIRATAV